MNTSTISNDTLNLTSALEIIQRLVAENNQLKTENQQLKSLKQTENQELKSVKQTDNTDQKSTTPNLKKPTHKMTKAKERQLRLNNLQVKQIIRIQEIIRPFMAEYEEKYDHFYGGEIMADYVYQTPKITKDPNYFSLTDMKKEGQELHEWRQNLINKAPKEFEKEIDAVLKKK